MNKQIKIFKNHPLNLVILCKNHHGYLDERRLKNGESRKRPALKGEQIKRLVDSRKKLNKRFLGDLRKEIKSFEKIFRQLNNFDKNIIVDVNKRLVGCMREMNI